MNYVSRTRLFGLPLIHVSDGAARGWIAIGGRAFGVLFAFGGLACGGICFGGLACGVVAIGGLGLGLLALGGAALGGYAIGGLAIGIIALGGGAIAWYAAYGGGAVAVHYAVGGGALAQHANDAAAKEFMDAGLMRFGRAVLEQRWLGDWAWVGDWVWLLFLIPIILALLAARRRAAWAFARLPKDFGPLQKIQGFDTSGKPIAEDVRVEQGGWRIEASEKRSVRLFEVPDPGVEDCTVVYRAKLKSLDLERRAYLEMWCRMPGGGEYFSKGLANPVKGTTDWASYETPFFLKKGERPDLLKLNIVIEGKGTLWVKDVELLQGPLPNE